MTAIEIFGRMSAPQASEILNWLHDNDRHAYRSCAGMLATRRKLRPVFVERKPREERNLWMREALLKPSNGDLALEILQVWVLGKNERMVCDFLDALKIPHDGKGLIDDLPSEPPAEKVSDAVEAILSNYPAAEVSIYLNLFAGMDDSGWSGLKKILASHPALSAEAVA
ncbi:MAG: hypothetical protein ACO3GO_01360 [Terrimicrobiaceae bacterium]